MPKTKKQTDGAKIAELVCRRWFLTKGFANLPDKFWNDKRFTRDYKLQIIKANQLLKLYSAEAILNVLNSKQFSNVYSLTAKWIDGPISIEEERLKRLKVKLEEKLLGQKQESEVVLPPNDTIRPSFSPKESIFDKLD